MYFNVLSFKNGKTLQFQSTVPYSVDKVKEPSPEDQYGDWNLVTDESNGQVLSFRGSEICTIATVELKEGEIRKTRKRKPSISVGRATE